MKNLCRFETWGGGGVWQMLTSSGGRSMLTGGRGNKICQNLAEVICARSLNNLIQFLNFDLGEILAKFS